MALQFGPGDYKDIQPMFGATFSCPKCGAPCSSYTAAQAHCQHSYNSKTCPSCRGSGKNSSGGRCGTCQGTGRVSF